MYYSKIKHNDIANGTGVRTSLFVSGCNFHCNKCFNQETWDFKHGQQYTENTEKEILDTMKGNYISGLSILGGDPLWQADKDIEKLKILVEKTKQYNKTVWIWSGFRWEELNEKQLELVSICDVFIDGRFIVGEKDLRLKWCGSSNQRVIDVKETLNKKEIILYDGE